MSAAKKSTFKVVDRAVAALPGSQDGPYSPSSRRALLRLLREHGWTEEQYLDRLDRSSAGPICSK